jgi:hypothetical protein
MTTQELLSVFPGSSEDIKRALDTSEGYPTFGVAKMGFYTANDKDRFAGIQVINVVAFDGRLTEIMVGYHTYPRGPRWLKVDDFIAKLSEAFTLPSAGNWSLTGDTDHGPKSLTCSGWEIQASISNGEGAGTLSLRNSAYKAVVQERAAADAERKRREFKP